MKTADSFRLIHENVTLNLEPGCEPRTPGTFLIPVKYEQKMLKRMSDLGMKSLSIYLRYLLREFKMSVFQEKFPRSERMKAKYQGSGLGLRRVSVRSSNTDWMVLSEISLGLGFSRCYVFVMLMELDLGIMGNIEVVPTPRTSQDNRSIKYAVAILQVIYPGSNRYQKKLKIYELSRLRNFIIQGNPHLFNLDGSFKYRL